MLRAGFNFAKSIWEPCVGFGGMEARQSFIEASPPALGYHKVSVLSAKCTRCDDTPRHLQEPEGSNAKLLPYAAFCSHTTLHGTWLLLHLLGFALTIPPEPL